MSTSNTLKKTLIRKFSIKSCYKLLSQNKVLIAFILVSITFLCIRFYKLPYNFKFAYDSQFAAETAWNIVKGYKLTLIGQETSLGGLFVGPFLLYLQTLAMFIGGFNPISLAYLAITVSFITMVILFFIVSELFNRQQGIIAIFLYAISTKIMNFDISSNAQSFVMIISLLIFWSSYKLFVKKQGKYLSLLAIGMAASFHIHFALFLLVPLILLLFLLYRPKIKLKYFLYSLLIFIVSLAPIILFDLRHDYLIAKNLLKFSSEESDVLITKTMDVIQTFLALANEIMFSKNKYQLFIPTSFFLGFSIIMLKNQRKEILVLTLLFILVPLFSLCFYRGPVPEYYFLPIVPILLIIASTVYYYLFKNIRFLFILLMIFIILVNTYKIKSKMDISESFAFKDGIVRWVINDAGDSNFNVYYDLPLVINNGYTYLFKWKQKEPIDYANNLYIITLQSKIDSGRYKESFPDKVKVVNNFGIIGVISVK